MNLRKSLSSVVGASGEAAGRNTFSADMSDDSITQSRGR